MRIHLTNHDVDVQGKTLGRGAYGQVRTSRERRANKQVAIKKLQAREDGQEAGCQEIRIFSAISANDEEDLRLCCRILDHFAYRRQIHVVMDVYGPSLDSILRNTRDLPLTSSEIKHIAKQMFSSVAFLHDIGIIHTDLKLENILGNKARQRTQRTMDIRIVDFGLAVTVLPEGGRYSHLITTCYYRSPEVFLEVGWSIAADIWSIGCILVELVTGRPLFHTTDAVEHLAMMQHVCGHAVDRQMVKKVYQNARSNALDTSDSYVSSTAAA